MHDRGIMAMVFILIWLATAVLAYNIGWIEGKGDTLKSIVEITKCVKEGNSQTLCQYVFTKD